MLGFADLLELVASSELLAACTWLLASDLLVSSWPVIASDWLLSSVLLAAVSVGAVSSFIDSLSLRGSDVSSFSLPSGSFSLASASPFSDFAVLHGVSKGKKKKKRLVTYCSFVSVLFSTSFTFLASGSGCVSS